MSKPLSPKQEKFVELRASGMTVEDAAAQSGYKVSYAYQLVKKPQVARAIQERQKAAAVHAAQSKGISPEWVLERLGAIAGANIADCYNDDGTLRAISSLPAELQQALEYVETKVVRSTGGDHGVIVEVVRVKLKDTTKALDKLGQHFKLFTEVHEIMTTEEKARRMAEGRRRAFATWLTVLDGGKKEEPVKKLRKVGNRNRGGA